jgi:Cadherin-like/Poly(ADP-ribose) polymerase catalytic domain
VNQGQTLVLNSDNLSATDSDNASGSLIFTVSNVQHGHFSFVSNPNLVIFSFMQQQLSDAQVVFVHTGGQNAPTYTVSVGDGATNTSPVAAIVHFNADPVLVNNRLTIALGQTVILSREHVSATGGLDNDPATLMLTVTEIEGGRFELVSNPGVAINSFTQEMINERQVQFVDLGGGDAPVYKISVSNGVITTPVAAATIDFQVLTQTPEPTPTVNRPQADTTNIPLIAGIAGGVAGFGLAAATVYCYKKRPPIVPEPLKSWQSEYDERLKRLSDCRTVSAEVPMNGGRDAQKVMDCYQRAPVPGYDIRSIKVIYNANANGLFEGHLERLQGRHADPVFQPQWSAEDGCNQRQVVLEHLEQISAPYRDPDYPSVKILAMWHGTSREAAEGISKGGFVDLAKTDAGFFGQGLYFAYEAEYACNVYNRGALFLSFVCFNSAYPVIDGDTSRLFGRARYQNYDAHFIPVKPADPNNPSEIDYYPCGPQDAARYHELVVFESAQCLPRYLIELQPSLPRSMQSPVASNPSKARDYGSRLQAVPSMLTAFSRQRNTTTVGSRHRETVSERVEFEMQQSSASQRQNIV